MQYKKLGNSDLEVSEICLGTMTFGQQNSMAEAHELLDYALSRGVNFIDSAEMYPVPTREETQGLTEEYVGHWLKNQPRDRIVLATKISGPGRRVKWIRGGPKAIDRTNVEQAVTTSLKRLQTDYIDLYQLHWPDRYAPIFGQTSYDPAKERPTVPIAEQLAALGDMIKAGKIRYIGLSNETPWGVAEFVKLAEASDLPKVVSIQNAYSLLNRVFEMGLAEMCRHENVGLLAYSPMAFGVLSGKYLGGDPANARLTLFPDFGHRYRKQNVTEAVAAYSTLARKINLQPSVLALAFARSRWFTTSVVSGATTLKQLKENLSSVDINLAPEMLEAINTIHARCPNPAT
jgi:aryl-alcohol dehydrogenase (NADP+)